MCPVAAESKNSKSSSQKKINKKINTNLGTVVEEDINKNDITLYICLIKLPLFLKYKVNNSFV